MYYIYINSASLGYRLYKIEEKAITRIRVYVQDRNVVNCSESLEAFAAED